MAVKVSNFSIDNGSPLTLIAGPCVIESKDLIHDVAGSIKEITESLGIHYIFKSSLIRQIELQLIALEVQEWKRACLFLRASEINWAYP